MLWSISQDYHNLGYLFVCVHILGLISVLISGLIWDPPMAGFVVKFGVIMAYFETVLVVGLMACV